MQGPESTNSTNGTPGLAPTETDARTRNRLLRAAVNVFDRKGYQAASVREIVEQAGVTKPALYYHFGNKEGVLVAILEEAARDFEAVIQNAVKRPGTARERLVGLCEDFHGLFSANVPVVRVLHTVVLGPADTAPPFDFLAFERMMVAGISEIVQDGIKAGDFRPVDATDVALALLGVVGTVAGRQLHPGVEPVSVDGMRRVLNVVFDGVFTVRAEQGERA
jgi:AcrR family transcriptional regulator